jgi:hypothetical protein
MISRKIQNEIYEKLIHLYKKIGFEITDKKIEEDVTFFKLDLF